MNKSKPFLFGLGIGLIVAGLVVQTSHWITQAGQLELPIPSEFQSPEPGAPVAPGPQSSDQPPIVDAEKEELKKQVDLLRKRTERLQSELAVKPVVKVYIVEGMGSFTISSILKRSGVIETQGPFMNSYASFPGFSVKEGLYEFRSNMLAEEALFVIGAPVKTPEPTASTTRSESNASPTP
jgi:hypothetical protein